MKLSYFLSCFIVTETVIQCLCSHETSGTGSFLRRSAVLQNATSTQSTQSIQSAQPKQVNEDGVIAERSHQNTSIYCRVTLVDSMYVTHEKESDSNSSHIFFSDSDSLKTEHRHSESCIPIVNWAETDDLIPITLPKSIRSKYKNEIRKGSLLISVKNAILKAHKLSTNEQTKYVVVSNPPERLRRLQASASELDFKSSMTVAVVRISTTDATPQASAAVLRDTYFGYRTNFVRQYEACSFGRLKWTSAEVGVIDIKLGNVLSFYGSAGNIINAAQDSIVSNMGISSVSNLADRIIMCLPPGTGSWAASAGVRHWRVQMNSPWCRSLTGTMHELGHTMGLLHSHADGKAYNDRTGMMGSGSEDPDGPLKCFNGYNNFQFRWYSSRHLELNANDIATDGRLINVAAFVDFNNAAVDEPVIVVLASQFYLQYNRKKGFNSGTEQKENEITITTPRTDGTDCVAGLSPGDKYQVPNFLNTGTLVIHACQRIQASSSVRADLMQISVAIGKSLCSLSTTKKSNSNNSKSVVDTVLSKLDKARSKVIDNFDE